MPDAMTLPTPPTPRLKTTWFRHGAGRGAAQQASAAAFIVWRIARHMLDRTRRAGFDVEIGAPYFAFLREALAALAAAADRVAYARLDPAGRVEFTSALVHHLARILQDSEDDLIGPAAQGRPSHGETFVDFVNELAGHYAEFGEDTGFAFMRYLGHRLEGLLPAKDHRWVQDQVVTVEGPEAIAMLRRSLGDLFDPPRRRPRREGMSGE